MKLLFDANIPRKSQVAVAAIFGNHEFIPAWESPFNPYMQDIELIRTASAHGIDVIITHDLAQIEGLDRRDERRTLEECGLHWLGLPQPFKVPGARAKAGLVAGSLTSNLEYALKIFRAAKEPTAVLLKPAPTAFEVERFYPQAIRL